MTEPDDLTRRLDALGRTSPPPPSPALLDDLDAGRLRRPAHRARPFRLPVLLPVAAVAAAVLGFVLITFGGDSPRTVVIQTASDASVQQDQRSAPASVGQTLEEGDRVLTGPAGSVTVGDVTLGPNEEAVVRGGRLRRLRRALERRATTTTSAPATTTTVGPASPAGPAATAPPPTTSPAAPDHASIPVEVQLVGRRLANGEVGLRWSQYAGADFGGYVVLREDRDVVARRAAVDGVRALDREPPGTPTRYVVVVFDRARRAVARSQVIRL